MCHYKGFATVWTAFKTYGYHLPIPIINNSDLYVHRCLEKIKKIHKPSCKYGDQQQYKVILESAMIYTSE